LPAIASRYPAALVVTPEMSLRSPSDSSPGS